jgi:glycosyltransferase involved in cell wall biosynthesis
MNIWMISKYASPPGYGTGLRFFYLTKEFGLLGHNTILFTSDANHYGPNFPKTDKIVNEEVIDNTKIIWYKTKKYKKTASIERVLSWLDFEWKLFTHNKDNLDKPDVVVISSLSIFTIVYGYYLKKKYNAFLVFEIRDIWPLTMTEEAGFKWYHPMVLLIGWFEKFGYKHADLVVGTMPKLGNHVKEILGYERPSHCCPIGFYPKDYENLEIEENPFDSIFPKGKKIIGYAGSMGITNALESYIECIELLDKENPNIHFMMVGSGDFKAKFEEKLSKCSNVTFLPRIKQSEVKYFLAKCDILFLSTQDSKVWDYGQSMNKVVEYMLAAKPILARYSGYPSMINEADCGIFVDTNSTEDMKTAILSMVNLSDPELKELGLKGRKWIYDNRTYTKLALDYLNEIVKLKSNV